MLSGINKANKCTWLPYPVAAATVAVAAFLRVTISEGLGRRTLCVPFPPKII